jgi:hypothetical protein
VVLCASSVSLCVIYNTELHGGDTELHRDLIQKVAFTFNRKYLIRNS